jgi:hypothetical protein
MFLMVKSVTQIAFIVLKKTVYRANEGAHAIIFMFSFLAYLVFNMKHKAFGYERVWMWHVHGLVGVLWLGLLATINYFSGGNSIAYTVLLFLGFAIIVFFGLLLQHRRYPALLYQEKGSPIENLIRFSLKPNRLNESFPSFTKVHSESVDLSEQMSSKVLPELEISEISPQNESK